MTTDKLAEALRIAEAALADIGDADREPGDNLAWCEKRAADALPHVREALAAHAADAARPKLGEFDARDSVRAHPDTTTLQRNADEDMQPAAQVKPLEMFTRWFTANYPGPDTIISDPNWHAPRIFRAAKYALMLDDVAAQPAAQAGMTLEQVRDSLRDVGLHAGSDYKRVWAYELADAIDAVLKAQAEPVEVIGCLSIRRFRGCDSMVNHDFDYFGSLPDGDYRLYTHPPAQPPDARDAALLQWAVGRWNAEVANRPLANVHRRSLDDAWRQVVRHAGGDDVVILGPRHDDLVVAAREASDG